MVVVDARGRAPRAPGEAPEGPRPRQATASARSSVGEAKKISCCEKSIVVCGDARMAYARGESVKERSLAEITRKQQMFV
jgi:hypothetical protein